MTQAISARCKLVIFDLDGTLVDSLPDICGALNHALAAAQLPPVDRAVVAELVGDGVMSLAERALARLPEPPAITAAELAASIVARYRALPCIDTRPFPDIEALLEGLARSGSKLAVVTNKTGDVARAMIATLGWADRFAAVRGDGDGLPRKPAPALGRSLLDTFNVTPGETVMVGDGLPDVAFARAVGCAVAAVGWGYTDRARLLAEDPDHFLESPLELLSLALRGH
jgi:phosphoglycolate phosphatase